MQNSGFTQRAFSTISFAFHCCHWILYGTYEATSRQKEIHYTENFIVKEHQKYARLFNIW